MSIQDEGYVLLRGAVPGGTVDELRTLVDDAVARRGEGVQVRAGTVWIKDAGVLGSAVDALCATDDVVDAVTSLLGPRPVVVGVVMRNPVGATAQQALHVDWAGPVPPGADEQAQAMFFLDDVDGDNGPPRVVPGTHRSRSVPPKALAADPRARHPAEVSVTGAAGDVLVFSSHLWHSGTANLSGRPRRVLTATYRRA